MADTPATPFAEAAARVADGGDHHAEATALVARMTLDEKLSCLDGDEALWPGLMDMMAGGYHRHTFPAAAVERLGIPGIDFADGPRGCVISPATAFPVSMARGATFDPELEERVGDAIGAELRVRGATYTGAVCMNLLRHPAWGRAQETYGEDPQHVGAMATALTTGLQRHVMACMKHFACQSMENARFTVDVTCDDRALHEVYLPHFRTVAEAGVASVMSAYSSLNGDWCGENEALLIGVLRDEWGWDGFVTSDFIFGLPDAVASVTAGLNIEMPFRQQRAQVLAGAVADGSLDESVVDARVVETVATLLRFAHVFDHVPDEAVVLSDEHRALAREAAAAAMVLLHDRGDLLPVDGDDLTKVAVLGRLAAVPNLGDHGSSNVFPPEDLITTPLAGLRAALPDVEVVHADDDAAIADGADLVVVVVGYTKHDEGEFLDQSATGALFHLFPPMDDPELGFGSEEAATEALTALAGGGSDAEGERPGGEGFSIAGGDRASLRLHPGDEALIAAACERSERVVVCVMGGSAVVAPWLGQPAATLVIWYPGMEGGHALADVLLGRVEPGGRLPFVMPTDESHLVPFDRDATTATYGLLHGQWKLDADDVASEVPFGWGLGYTTWSVEAAEVGEADQRPAVRVEVANTGARHGSTVVQVYASVPGSAFERPPRRLVGFARVAADAGHEATVVVPLDLRQLPVRDGGRWVTEDLPVVLHVGRHAGDPESLTLHTELHPG